MNLNFTQTNGSTKLLLMLFCMIMLIFGIAAKSPANIPQLQTQETPAPADQTPVLTALPTETITPTTTPFPDWAMTSKDTNGLLVAGILILLIIIVGTLTAIAINSPGKQESIN